MVDDRNVCLSENRWCGRAERVNSQLKSHDHQLGIHFNNYVQTTKIYPIWTRWLRSDVFEVTIYYYDHKTLRSLAIFENLQHNTERTHNTIDDMLTFPYDQHFLLRYKDYWKYMWSKKNNIEIKHRIER